MNSVAEDIKDILAAESSLGLTFATDLFVGKEPSQPDTCVTIFDTPGAPPQLTFTQGEDYFYDSFNIRVRSNNYRTAYALGKDIVTVLHGLGQQTWNGTLYSLIRCTNSPALLDWDENNRCRFIMNFDTQRR